MNRNVDFVGWLRSGGRVVNGIQAAVETDNSESAALRLQ
jgi:hypothetical protein